MTNYEFWALALSIFTFTFFVIVFLFTVMTILKNEVESRIPSKASEPKWYALTIENKKLPILLGFAIVGLWLISGIIIIVSVGKWDHRGQLGDLFGAVNALFSGLAFGGIIYTIFLQQKEMKTQSEEFKAQGVEFKKQSDAFVKQNNLLATQSFESTFFNMTVAYEDTVKNFSSSLNNVWNSLEILVLKGEYTEGKDNLKDAFENFSKVVDGPSYKVSHYVYKHFALIVDFTNASEVNERGIYYTILKSKLRERDVQIMFFQYHLDTQAYHSPLWNVDLLGRSFVQDFISDKLIDATMKISGNRQLGWE